MDNPADPPREQTWGPRPAVLLVGTVLTVGAIWWLVGLAASPEDRVVAAVVALVLAATTAATALMRRRLTAGPDGLLVRTPLQRRLVPWAEVNSIQVMGRRRMGVASSLLEIETSDDDLLLFGRFDLGSDPAEVAPAVQSWWHRGGARP